MTKTIQKQNIQQIPYNKKSQIKQEIEQNGYIMAQIVDIKYNGHDTDIAYSILDGSITVSDTIDSTILKSEKSELEKIIEATDLNVQDQDVENQLIDKKLKIHIEFSDEDGSYKIEYITEGTQNTVNSNSNEYHTLKQSILIGISLGIVPIISQISYAGILITLYTGKIDIKEENMLQDFTFLSSMTSAVIVSTIFLIGILIGIY